MLNLFVHGCKPLNVNMSTYYIRKLRIGYILIAENVQQQCIRQIAVISAATYVCYTGSVTSSSF